MVQLLQQPEAPLHFRRIEIKYLLPDRYLPALRRSLAPYVTVDPYLAREEKGRTRYHVTSLYYDSHDLHSVQEKNSGLLARWKMRLRTYEEFFSPQNTGSLFLEIKRRQNFIILKDRCHVVQAALKDERRLQDPSSLFNTYGNEGLPSNEIKFLFGWYSLQPMALVQYKREPFVALEDHRFRITIDSELRGVWQPSHIVGPQCYKRCMPGWNVLEVKCNNTIPAWFSSVIERMSLQRISHSKYVLVAKTLHPSRVLFDA